MAKRKKDKRKTDYLQSTTQKTKNRATRTPLTTGGKFSCSRTVSSSCSTSDTCRVTLVTNTVINHEWGTDPIVITTNGTYPWSFVTQLLRNYSVTVNQSIGEWWNVYQIIQIQILLLAQTHQQDMVYIAQLHDKMWYKLYIICK